MQENNEAGLLRKHDFGRNAVIVTRVSTAKQTTSPQQHALEMYARQLGYRKIKNFGTTESGFLETDDKQGWNLVVDFFESHPDFHVLICTELSRLSRLESTLFVIRDYLIDHKIQLIVKDINFVLFDEWGNVDDAKKLVFSLFASLSNSEMRQKKERFKRALVMYKQQGYSIGGRELFGYDRVYVPFQGKNRSMYQINEKEAEEIRTIFRWYAYGLGCDASHTSIRTITEACIVNGFSPYLHSTKNVWKCLREEAYLGEKTTHGRRRNAEYWNYKHLDAPKYEDSAPYVCRYPVILSGDDAALFDLVRKRMLANSSHGGNVEVDKSRSHVTILSRLLVCPVCGNFLIGEYRVRNGAAAHTYRCGKSHVGVEKCAFSKALSMPMMDSIIWADCKNAVSGIRRRERGDASVRRSQSIVRMMGNLDLKLRQCEERVRTEELILRNRMRYAAGEEDRNEAIVNFKKRMLAIGKSQQKIEKSRQELEKELERLNASREEDSVLPYLENVQADKSAISRYVHRIVRSVDLIYTDRSYTVLKVTYNNGEWSELCNLKYLCVFKQVTQDIRILSLSSSKGPDDLEWSESGQCFRFSGASLMLDGLYRNWHTQSAYPSGLVVRELGFEKLNCYASD